MTKDKFDPELYETVFVYKAGALVEEVRPKMRITKKDPYNRSAFMSYDTSAGHCALCGSLSCRGSCFK